MLGELAKTTIISALLTIDVCILVCRRHQVHPPPQGKVKTVSNNYPPLATNTEVNSCFSI